MSRRAITLSCNPGYQQTCFEMRTLDGCLPDRFDTAGNCLKEVSTDSGG